MSFIEKLPAWLRWILLPIASIGVYVASYLMVSILGSLIDFLSRSPYGTNFSTHVIAPGFAGYWAIAAIALVAPGARSKAALVGAGCWMFVFGIATFLAILKPGWDTFLPVVFSVAGLVYGLVEVNERDA